MASIRDRVQMFHSSTSTERGFRFANSADGLTTDVYVYDYIGGWDGVLAKDVVAALSKTSNPVNLHINSGGGDIFEGVAIHNAFKNHAAGVTTYVDGIAASAASFIAMAGEKVIMEPNATLMIHDGMGLTMGNEQDHIDAAAILGQLSNTIAEMYTAKAGSTTADWRKKMRVETWYTAAEAVTSGLADEIAGSNGAAPSNSFDLSIFNYAGREAAPAPVPVNTATPAPVNTAPPLDMDGLRNALKGAFA